MLPFIKMPPIEFLEESVFQDDEGFLVWKDRPIHHFSGDVSRRKFNTTFSGKRCGGKDTYGYLSFRIRSQEWRCACRQHSVVFFMKYGYNPEYVDHLNGIRHDNRIENLRAASALENARHRTFISPMRGIKKYQNKFLARISFENKEKHLGMFDTLEAAQQARFEAEIKYYGDFRPKSFLSINDFASS